MTDDLRHRSAATDHPIDLAAERERLAMIHATVTLLREQIEWFNHNTQLKPIDLQEFDNAMHDCIPKEIDNE